MQATYYNVYEDRAGRWRWWLQAPNGRKCAREAQGRGYADARGCVRAIRRVMETARLSNGEPAPIIIAGKKRRPIARKPTVKA